MDEENVEHIIELKPYRSICVNGPSSCGKTHWVFKYLENLAYLYRNNVPKKFCIAMVFINLYSLKWKRH